MCTENLLNKQVATSTIYSEINGQMRCYKAFTAFTGKRNYFKVKESQDSFIANNPVINAFKFIQPTL